VRDGAPTLETCTSSCRAGSVGSGDGQFNSAEGVAVDQSGNVFVGENGNPRIQKFDNNGNFLTKWGNFGTAEGQFIAAGSLTVDQSGNVFAVDEGNNRIQKFTNTGTFLLTFGWGVRDGAPTFETCTSSCRAGDSGPGDGQFASPTDIAVDGNGNVFVADYLNHRMQKLACP
jgi:hypothetical protein